MYHYSLQIAMMVVRVGALQHWHFAAINSHTNSTIIKIRLGNIYFLKSPNISFHSSPVNPSSWSEGPALGQQTWSCLYTNMAVSRMFRWDEHRMKIPLQKRDLYLEGHAGCHKLYFKDRITAHVRKSAAPNALTIHKRQWHRASTTTAAKWRKGGDGVFCTVKAGGKLSRVFDNRHIRCHGNSEGDGKLGGRRKTCEVYLQLVTRVQKSQRWFFALYFVIILFHFFFYYYFFFGWWRWWGCAVNDV